MAGVRNSKKPEIAQKHTDCPPYSPENHKKQPKITKNYPLTVQKAPKIHETPPGYPPTPKITIYPLQEPIMALRGLKNSPLKLQRSLIFYLFK